MKGRSARNPGRRQPAQKPCGVRRRHGRPGRVGHQRLTLQRLHDDLEYDAAGDPQYQRMPRFTPEPVQARGDQPVQYAGQAAVARQSGIAPPQPAVDSQGGEHQHRQHLPAQACLEHCTRQQQRGNVPQGVAGVAVHPVAGQQAPPFALRDGLPVEDPALGRGPEGEVRSDGSRAEQPGTPRQRRAAVARAIGRFRCHDRRPGVSRTNPASHATQARGRSSSTDQGPRAPPPL